MRLFLWRRVNSMGGGGAGMGGGLTGSAERRGRKDGWNRCESSGQMRGELTRLLVPTGHSEVGLKSCWGGNHGASCF